MTADRPQSHYFDAQVDTPSRPGRVVLALPDVTLVLTTDRGVFGVGGVDPGTKLLLLDGPRPDPAEQGDLLDLGCGYGPVALALAQRAPWATVWAVDVNDRARELCATNAGTAGLANVRVAAPEEVPATVRFAGIWSNPPVRVGKTALHELLARWLDRLDGDASATLVVHKHLGSDSLTGWLRGRGHDVARLTSKAGYRLLAVGAATAAP